MKSVRSLISICLFATIFITSCAMTKITAVWKSPEYFIKPNKIMVIAIAKNQVSKRLLEDNFAQDIKINGTDAIPSYTIIPDEKQTDDALIATKMKEQGADAVLITRFADRKTAYKCVPGSDFSSNYNMWSGYYQYGIGLMCSSGYVSEDEYAIMETNLYDAGKSNLIWSASSKTEILNSDANFIKAYVKYIVKALVKQKVLK
ncbi:MAG: hypothetical protein A2539_01315 [Elusimicrobia bacterium RIFOXYD2_FULL_34_15]|nr:MAG: hypothetical protein A2539_01315 [Elusimicrobia bacterium RIFOXYD2_FULL_34_15]